jgi:MEMO1 family protein
MWNRAKPVGWVCRYGAILAPYLADPQNLVVVSSDFCHWGQRFRYTWRDSARGHIHQSIEWLDKQVY